MKTLNIVFRFNMILLVLFISSCVRSSDNVSSTPTSTSIPQTSSTVALTNIPITSTTPPVVTPNIPVEDARTRLIALLSNNGDCFLPCLWGITPGASTYQDAQSIFVPLSVLSERTSFNPEGGAVSLKYLKDDLILGAFVTFNVDTLSDNHIINNIGLDVRVVEKMNSEYQVVFNSDFFKEHLDYYMLPNILTEYGAPTTVMLSAMAKLPSSGISGGFKVLLLYPDEGILVNYTMQMQVIGENIMGCPVNAHVELDLYPSGHGDSFVDLLEPSGWAQIIQNTYKPLDASTSMSQLDFYQIFSQPTDECLLTPANIWPVPD